jgi:hypothetical protein
MWNSKISNKTSVIPKREIYKNTTISREQYDQGDQSINIKKGNCRQA